MKNKLFKYFAIAIASISISAIAQDADLKERRELATKVMQANQQGLDLKKMTAAIVEPMKVTFVGSLRRSNPNQTEAYYGKVSEVVTREASAYMDSVMTELMPSMMQNMAGLYAENFTVQELNELLKIYENPLVKRGMIVAIDGMPKLMTPFMQSIQKRAELMGPRIGQALAREGLLPQPMR